MAYAPARIHIDVAQPLVVATNWGPFGFAVWSVLAGTCAAAAIPYVILIRRNALPLSALLAASALALAAAFLWHPLFSSDVYAYAAYGEMARLGMNPYVHLTVAAADPYLSAAQWQWSGAYPACVYGSAFVSLARVVVSFTGLAHVATALAGFRLLSCASLLACIALAYRLDRRAALFFGLNPVALWAAAEGHNDTLAIACVLAGVLMARRFATIGALVMASAAAIKAPALAAAWAFVIAFAASSRRLAAIAGAAMGTLIALIASQGLIAAALTQIAPHGTYTPAASVQSLGVPITLIAAALVLWRLRAFPAPFDRACTVALAGWIAIPNPYAWYGIWLLTLCAFARDVRVRYCAIAVSTAALLHYAADATQLPQGGVALLLGACALVAYAPLFAKEKRPAEAGLLGSSELEATEASP